MLDNLEKEYNEYVKAKYFNRKITQKTVDILNKYQQNLYTHPYTCGGNRKDKYHLDNEGVLFATLEGWKCLYCSFTQLYEDEVEEMVNLMTK